MEIDSTEAKLNVHEAVCAERYLGINDRLKRIELWFVGCIGAIISLMATIILRGI